MFRSPTPAASCTISPSVGSQPSGTGNGRAAAPSSAPPSEPVSDETAADETAAAEPAAFGGARTGDAVVDALAGYVASSDAWSLGLQRFLLDACRSFDDADEVSPDCARIPDRSHPSIPGSHPRGSSAQERHEWFDLHQQYASLAENLLEDELARLGVSADDFVQRLKGCTEGMCRSSASANTFLEAVLAIDDYQVRQWICA